MGNKGAESVWGHWRGEGECGRTVKLSPGSTAAPMTLEMEAAILASMLEAPVSKALNTPCSNAAQAQTQPGQGTPSHALAGASQTAGEGRTSKRFSTATRFGFWFSSSSPFSAENISACRAMAAGSSYLTSQPR